MENQEPKFNINEKGRPSDYTEKKEFWERTEKKIQSDFLCRPYVFEAIGNPKGKTVVDIGCGEGYVARYLANAGAKKVIGIDNSEGLIKSAQEKEKEDNLGIEYNIGSALELGIRNESVDTVASVLVYGHFKKEDLDKANQEVARVLKEKGEFILAVPHPFYYVDKPKSKWVDFDEKEPDYWKEENNIILRTADNKSFEITARNHTFSDYLNSLLENGFQIEKIIEPNPTNEDLATYPEMWGEETRLPTYLIIKSRKISR